MQLRPDPFAFQREKSGVLGAGRVPGPEGLAVDTSEMSARLREAISIQSSAQEDKQTLASTQAQALELSQEPQIPLVE